MSFACREAAGATGRLLSGEAAEARGQARQKEIGIMVNAMIARSVRPRGATDRSLIILVVPRYPPGMSRELTIKNNPTGSVFLSSFEPGRSSACLPHRAVNVKRGER